MTASGSVKTSSQVRYGGGKRQETFANRRVHSAVLSLLAVSRTGLRLIHNTVRRGSLAATAATLFFCVSLSAQEEDAPTDDFLEYLATLVEQDGEWVDPMDLEELPDDDADLAQMHQASDDAETAEETP